jgi:uncharacterized DUF497 family protein
MATDDKPLVLTDEQKRRMRRRNIAIGLALTLLVVIFYAVTIVKIGSGLAGRPV